MIRRKLTGVCCLLSLCYVMAGATPIAMSQISSDLKSTTIKVNDGGSADINGYDSPLMSYMLQQSGFENINELAPDGESSWSDALPGAEIYVESVDGAGLSRAYTSVNDGYAIATSVTSSYLVYDAINVSTVDLSLDVSTILNLTTENVGELSFGQVENYLDLWYYDEFGNSQLLGTSNYYMDDFAVDGSNSSRDTSHTHTISVDVIGALGHAYNGQLVLQSTLIAHTDVDVIKQQDVPEPASLSLMVMGLAMLLPLALRRKNK